MIIWLGLLASILAIVFLLLKVSYYNTKVPNGLKPIPLIEGRVPLVQHTYSLYKLENEMLEHCRKMSDIHGDIWKLYVPTTFITKPRAITFSCNPEVLQFVLSTGFKQGLFAKGVSSSAQYKEFLGSGIFTSNGERWSKVREFASSLFHVSSLKQYVNIFDENAKNLFSQLDANPNGIDMQDYFMRYTLDSFAEIGFGVKINSMKDDVNMFAKAFDLVQMHCNRRGRVGPFIWKAQETLFPPKEFKSSVDYMNDFVNTIIQQRKQDSKEQLLERGDLVSRLLVHEKCAFNQKDEDLRDFIMNFLIAGRDTTAVLLTWCVYLLSKHPEVEKKLLKEFDDVLGDEEPTFANTKELIYCKHVLQETLRLFPPVPMDGFEAQETCELPGGYYVEKGSVVIYCAYDLHRRPELWGDDSDEFKPERFAKPPVSFSWLPFHGGPRECLGKEMAYLEAKIMLVNLLRKYKLTVHTNHPVELKKGIILTSRHGMKMDVVKR